MRRSIILAMSAAVLFSGCGTYQGEGAYTGTVLGSILGSAIGGISDGPRGSDVGTIIGMAGGAIVGSAIGSAADKQRQEDIEQYRMDKERRAATRRQRQSMRQQDDTYLQTDSSAYYGSGLDESNSADDRIYDFNGSDYTDTDKGQRPVTVSPGSSKVESISSSMTYTPTLEIRNARFIDDNGDNEISRGELCKVIFEVINRGSATVYDVQPTVIEANGNRHLFISPSIHVERIAPGKGIRYTAIVKADNRLRDGQAKICISVIQGQNEKISKVSEFNIPTRSR